MKKTIIVLPFFAFFAFCSSSKKAVTPAAPGISNVNVSRGDSMVSASKAGASFTSADRDWAYKSSRDTALNGTWTLSGMVAADGSWASTAAATSTITDTAYTAMSDTTATATGTSATSKTGRSSKSKKPNRRALYDAANSRLKLNYKDTTVRDTTILPFEYWKRTPTLSINAARGIFTGNTGCNSMSGSFNFGSKDIQFSRNIVTSKMACNEYDESVFISALRKADNYTLNGNTLELRQGSTLLLSFVRS